MCSACAALRVICAAERTYLVSGNVTGTVGQVEVYSTLYFFFSIIAFASYAPSVICLNVLLFTHHPFSPPPAPRPPLHQRSLVLFFSHVFIVVRVVFVQQLRRRVGHAQGV